MSIEVSIITPSFNSGKFISKTIESVLEQTFENWEMIIVDDCSNDNSLKIIKEYCKKDARIKLIVLDKNGGSGKARNIAIKKSRGRYLAFLDSDDYWASSKLEKQIVFMQKNNCPFTYSQYYEFNNNTGNIETIVKCPSTVTYKMLLVNGGYIGCLTVIYDTTCFGKRYMPEIRKRQDWALWVKMLKEIKFAKGIQEPLAYYRTGHTSLSKNKFKLVKYNFTVFYKVLGMSYIECLYRMTLFLMYHLFFKSKLRIKLKA
ncbi:glycosyltransferase family 2 protein [Aestuariivivens sediminis]|uniref:glycosyltransferase family 2 protein n=1 Tax=Aestuariivivens sediminis TaxID=2913557 RepID=UPI001F58F96F